MLSNSTDRRRKLKEDLTAIVLLALMVVAAFANVVFGGKSLVPSENVNRIKLNDTTNAFKAYRKTVIDGCHPLISPHFNLTVELPLKAIVRGYSWTALPTTWRNRRHGIAKLQIKEMGSRYLFSCLYVWLEKHFSRGDYRKQ